MSRIVVITFAALALLAVAGAESARRHYRIDSNVVLIPVGVFDRDNRPVDTLRRDDFRVFEDGAQQRLSYFSTDDAPVSVAVVFDSSGSMRMPWQYAREAFARLVDTANPEDEFALVEVQDRPRLLSAFTRDLGTLQNASLAPRGFTALLDGVYLAASVLNRTARHPRRAVVVISDGGDNHSRYSESEVRGALLEMDVQVYAAGLNEVGVDERERGFTGSENAGAKLLMLMASQTGGRHFPVRDLGQLRNVAERIASEMHHRYLLAYRPSNAARDGRFRRIRVEVAGAPKLRVYAKTGYYAPME